MFDVAVESGLAETRITGCSFGDGGSGVESPFALAMTENEGSTCMGSGEDKYQCPKHVIAARSVLMRLEEPAWSYKQYRLDQSMPSSSLLTMHTVNVQLIQLKPDGDLRVSAYQKGVSYAGHDCSTPRLKRRGEAREIDPSCLAVRFVRDGVVTATERGYRTGGREGV